MTYAVPLVLALTAGMLLFEFGGNGGNNRGAATDVEMSQALRAAVSASSSKIQVTARPVRHSMLLVSSQQRSLSLYPKNVMLGFNNDDAATRGRASFVTWTTSNNVQTV
jgi:hypothetical protein